MLPLYHSTLLFLITFHLLHIFSSAASSKLIESRSENSISSTTKSPDIFPCSKPYLEVVKGRIKYSPNRDSYREDEYLHVSCAGGNPRKVLHCKKGVWEHLPDDFYHCPETLPCALIGSFENGYYNSTIAAKSSYPPSTRMFFHCHPGYQLVGAPTLLCISGPQWSYKPPSCLPLSPPEQKSILSTRIIIFIIGTSLFSIIILLITSRFAYQQYKMHQYRNGLNRYLKNWTYRSSQRRITRSVPSDYHGVAYTTPEAAQITDL